MLFPFIVRTVFIKTLDVEYLGLSSLFTSILTVLNLAELGFGSAVVFSMYKPIAVDDQTLINALLAYYRKVYRYVGIVVFVLGVALIPFLPFLINGPTPQGINIRIVYFVFLVNTVAGYFLFAYMGAIITAHQRQDVISRIDIFISIFMNSLQIVVLLTVKNYYAYLAVMPIFTVVNNFRTAIIAKKMFPQYSAVGVLPSFYRSDINQKMKGLIVSKVCTVSRNAFDNIFISIFLGLTITAIYGNYYLVLKSILMVVSVVANSIVAGVGNSVSMDSEKKNYDDMNRLNFFYMWFSGWVTVCLLSLYQPFMLLWVGKELMFPMSIVIPFCVYFYVLKMGDIRAVYVQAKGIWWENRFRAIAEAVLNVVLNYVLGKYWGVFGIIVATLISLFFINFCYGSHLIFKYYFVNQKIRKYYCSHAVYALVTSVACVILIS